MIRGIKTHNDLQIETITTLAFFSEKQMVLFTSASP